MPTKFSPAFDAYVEPARENNEIWRTILGVFIVAVVFIVASLVIVLAVFAVGELQMTGMGYRWVVFELSFGRTLLASFMAIAPLPFLILGLWVTLKYIHRRPLFSLIAPNCRIDWRIWQISAIIVLIYGAVNMIIAFATEDVTQQMSVIRWVPIAIVMTGLLFLQTAAEELVFRGYLQQQLAARFQSRWIWLVLPSLLFGALHWKPDTFGDNAWLVVCIGTLMGLIAADLTSRLGNLSAAMGLHFANNILAFVLLNVKGQQSGASLYLHEINAKTPEAAVGLVMSAAIMVAIYSVFLLIWRQRR